MYYIFTVSELRAEIEHLCNSGMSTGDTAYTASLAEISMLYMYYIFTVSELRAEIEHLRNSGMSTGDTAYTASLAEISTLKDRLQEKEKEVEEINRWGIIKGAPSSEFMSSSIPSWQISTAHAQPFRGARDLAFSLKVPLDSLLVWASSEGSGETARMRRLAWTFAARIGDKYQIRLARPIEQMQWLFPWKYLSTS